MRRRLAMVVGSVPTLLMAFTGCRTNEPTLVSDSGSGTTAPAAEATTPPQFAVGDRVELGSWQVLVHQVDDPWVSDASPLAADPGHRWVGVDVEVFNRGAQPEGVSAPLCFQLLDGENRSYPIELISGADVGWPDGEVAAGSSRRGLIIYEVPADAARLHLQFKCELFSRGTADIALEPAA